MREPIYIRVPLVPPSVNHYVKHTRRGRHYTTGKADAFKDAVAIFRAGQSVMGDHFTVHLRIVLGAGQRGDIDNFAKLPLDALAACGVFVNRKGKRVSDAHVRGLLIDRDTNERPDHGYTEIWVHAQP